MPRIRSGRDCWDAFMWRRHAHAHRGPWWWRLRVALADRMAALACWLEPDDKSSVSWYSDDRQTMHVATVRRDAP